MVWLLSATPTAAFEADADQFRAGPATAVQQKPGVDWKGRLKGFGRKFCVTWVGAVVCGKAAECIWQCRCQPSVIDLGECVAACVSNDDPAEAPPPCAGDGCEQPRPHRRRHDVPTS